MSVVAGRQLDLSGTLGCSHFDCQVPIVNNLFGRVWHYFDTVVIDEVSLNEILATQYDFREDLLQRVKLLLYLRDIGADKYVQFVHKVDGMCSEHFREYAERNHLGIDAVFSEDLERTVVQRIVAEGRFTVSFHDDGSWHYEIRHPGMGMITGTFAHSDIDHRPANEDIARDAFGAYCCGLIADVSASRTLELPLLQAVENDWNSDASEGSTIDDRTVALNLRLPVLSNAPVKEILKFRDDNSDSFEVFRAALSRAIRKQIKQQSEHGGSVSAQRVADAVVFEDLRPELARIELQLGGVRKALARKLGDNVRVAGATVGVGLIEHAPLVITITAAAVATSLADIINKRRDDKKEIETSDLYFLWKARTRSRRH